MKIHKFFNWNVTYGDIYPLGVRQTGILINGQFPGPDIHSVTNDNLIINVFNSLDEPFLISWNGIQQRRNSFEDGVFGTTCPIPPGKNFTYILQVKDQIGSFYYFPSLAFHKAAGGFGGIRILSRPRIPVPFPDPSGILINGQFPGPDIHSVTNDNLIINVFNSLDEPFLISWNGIQQRRNSFEDGVFGTTCPIPPGKNFTYILQVKDQIGSFYYFPSLAFHKAAGGFGGIRILSRPRIPVPFPDPS
ncbi:hypothetical protein RYX36_033359, partial [Vicia faba]